MMNRIFIFLSAFLTLLNSCNEAQKKTEITLENETLILTTAGKIINFNLETKQLAWIYSSQKDSEGNRNMPIFDEEKIYLPFESGKIIAFDIQSGKPIWTTYPHTNNEIVVSKKNSDGSTEILIDSLKAPYYIGRGLLAGNRLYMPMAGQPELFYPLIRTIDAKTGEVLLNEEITTNYNYFAPVFCDDFLFVNSAIYLEKYTLNDAKIAERKQLAVPFEERISAQIKSDGTHLYIADQNASFYKITPDEYDNLRIKSEHEGFSIPKFAEWNPNKTNKGIFNENSFAGNATELVNNTWIVSVFDENEKKFLIAWNTENGKLLWEREIPNLLSWSVQNNTIVALQKEKITLFNLKGKETASFSFEPNEKPISNIIYTPEKKILFACEKGIMKMEKNRKTEVLVSIPLKSLYHDFCKLNYFSKNN